MSNPICCALVSLGNVIRRMVPTKQLALSATEDQNAVKGADSRDTVAKHNQEILMSLLDQPYGGKQNDDDVKSEYHGQ